MISCALAWVFLPRVWWARVKPNSNPQPDVSGGSDVLARSSCFLVLALGIASVHAFWCTLIHCFAFSVHRLSICLRSLLIPIALRPFARYSIYRLSMYIAPYSIYRLAICLIPLPLHSTSTMHAHPLSRAALAQTKVLA